MKYRIIKYRYKVYRKYLSDVWGIYRTRIRSERYVFGPVPRIFWNNIQKQLAIQRILNSRYKFRLDLPHPILKPRDWKKDFRMITWRLVKYFYVYVNYRRFRKIRYIARTMEGPYLGNYILLLECRVSFLLYKLGYISDLFQSKDFAERGYFAINGKTVWNLHCPLGIYDFFMPSNDYHKDLAYEILIINFEEDRIIYPIPKYLFFDVYIYYYMVMRYPKLSDLIHPVYIDIFRGTQYLW